MLDQDKEKIIDANPEEEAQGENGQDREEEGSFAELFASSTQTPGSRFVPGQLVTGTVVKISKDTVFVDLGGKSEGTAETDEFRDGEKNLTVKEGDEIQLRVASLREGEIRLSKAIKARGAAAVQILREAQQSRMPVEGRVAAVKKGGFDVDVSGIRAFCPLSQIDLQYTERPEEHVGARYPFRVMEVKERGRNVVVSRRAILQEEQEKKAKETMATLQAGEEREGKVTRVTDFGAFVDIGGIEGMVHVSEISHARVTRPAEVLRSGQIVRVKVLKIDPDKDGRPRIGLSLKALEVPPWEKGFPFKEGEVIAGTVTRLADFGAFVEVAPGVDGLVHVSEISYERVPHPNRVLKEGDRVEVLVQKIDYEKRRISLSIKEAMIRERMAASEGEARQEVGQVLKGIVEDHKPYGIFVRLPQLGMQARGLLPMEELLESDRGDVKKRFPRGAEISVEIVEIGEDEKIRLSQKSMKDKEDREDYARYVGRKGKAGLGTLGEIFKNVKP